MRTWKKALAGASLGLLAVSSISLPAVAVPNPDVTIDSVPGLPAGIPDMGVSNEELVELSATQSEAEIDAIVTSDAPAVALVDDDGNVLSAVETSTPGISAFAVSPNYPYKDCASTPSSACLYTAKGSMPYKGTGSLSLTAKNITVVAAGDRRTKFTRSTGTVYDAAKYKQFRLATPGTITKIQR